MPLLASMMKALSLKGCEIHFAEEIKDFTNAMKEVAQAILMTNPGVRTDEEIFEATKKKGSEGQLLLDAGGKLACGSS